MDCINIFCHLSQGFFQFFFIFFILPVPSYDLFRGSFKMKNIRGPGSSTNIHLFKSKILDCRVLYFLIYQWTCYLCSPIPTIDSKSILEMVFNFFTLGVFPKNLLTISSKGTKIRTTFLFLLFRVFSNQRGPVCIEVSLESNIVSFSFLPTNVVVVLAKISTC